MDVDVEVESVPVVVEVGESVPAVEPSGDSVVEVEDDDDGEGEGDASGAGLARTNEPAGWALGVARVRPTSSIVDSSIPS